MRPLLRPGTHVLRRNDHELQVGLLPDEALVLPDTAPVRESLRRLRSCTPLDEHVDVDTVELLAREQRLVDEQALLPLLRGEADERGRVAALARRVGARVVAAHESRARCRTEVRGFGPEPVAGRLQPRLGALLHEAGLPPWPPRGTGSPGCGVLVGVGEPDRALTDGWTRTGTPYVLLRLVEGRVVLGPFVVPGRTACLRCLDAHATDADPAWPLLVRQYSSATARPRPDGLPEPVDPLLATLGLAWAARDVASYADGLRPSTWSATITLHAGLDRIESHRWLRHPGCGCGWDDAVAPSRTMEA